MLSDGLETLFTRVVFEKGIQLHRSDNNIWFFHYSGNEVSNIRDIPEKYGARPIVLAYRFLPEEEFTLLLPIDTNNQALELDFSVITNITLAPIWPIPDQMLDVGYVLGAACYHCEKLAEIYSHVSYKFAEVSTMLTNSKFGCWVEPYYEFEALMTSARRLYEMIRYPVWNVFGGSGSTPRNFIKVLKSCRDIPTTLSERLYTSWDRFGSKVGNYRDYILHYGTLGGALPLANIECPESGVILTSFKIPDNPEEKSPDKFKYDSQIDALTYGWTLVNELASIEKAIAYELARVLN